MNSPEFFSTFAITRRHFFAKTTKGLGTIGACQSASGKLAAAAAKRKLPAVCRDFRFCAEGEASYLSVSKRRAIAGGFVRLQAGAQSTQWRTASRKRSRRPAAHWNDRPTGLLTLAGSHFKFFSTANPEPGSATCFHTLQSCG